VKKFFFYISKYVGFSNKKSTKKKLTSYGNSQCFILLQGALLGRAGSCEPETHLEHV